MGWACPYSSRAWKGRLEGFLEEAVGRRGQVEKKEASSKPLHTGVGAGSR